MADLSPEEREPILTPLHRLLVAFVTATGVFSFAAALALLSWRL